MDKKIYHVDISDIYICFIGTFVYGMATNLPHQEIQPVTSQFTNAKCSLN